MRFVTLNDVFELAHIGAARVRDLRRREPDDVHWVGTLPTNAEMSDLRAHILNESKRGGHLVRLGCESLAEINVSYPEA